MAVAEYAKAEKAALLHTSNRIIESVEVMHENKSEYIYNNYLGGTLSSQEVALFEKIAAHIFSMTKTLYGQARVPIANLLLSLSIYRNLKLILSPSDTVIFEVGGGCGYLGAMLALDGFRVVSMDIAQAFYLYQNHLYRTLFGNNFIELANAIPGVPVDVALSNECRTGSTSKIIHLPWWKYYKPEPTSPPHNRCRNV